tara:strand:+ start:849 stop:1175 length:327 start_codon:yes stop_codon:yes gene_type:complete
MALNYVAVAGNNGVSGPTKAEVDGTSASGNSKVILPQATVSGTLAGNNFTANKTSALRWSVSQTQGTAGAPTSEVYSETCNLRYAYGNTSTIETDSGRYANGTATPRT